MAAVIRDAGSRFSVSLIPAIAACVGLRFKTHSRHDEYRYFPRMFQSSGAKLRKPLSLGLAIRSVHQARRV